MLPGYLDNAVMGFVLIRPVTGTPSTSEVVDANSTAARLLGRGRSELIGTPLEDVPGLEAIGSHWTDPSADGDSPVVVRARVGPAARCHVEVTITRQTDGGTLVELVDQSNEERLWDALDQERAILEREDEIVVLRVQDEGPGIPRHRQPLVFQRAYRTTHDSPENHSGLGIGLNVAQAIVIAHGGSLDVTSTPGDGAQFSLRLQAAPSVALVVADQEAS